MRDLAWQCPQRPQCELVLGWYEARAEGPKGSITLGFPSEDTLLLHWTRLPRHSPGTAKSIYLLMRRLTRLCLEGTCSETRVRHSDTIFQPLNQVYLSLLIFRGDLTKTALALPSCQPQSSKKAIFSPIAGKHPSFPAPHPGRMGKK